MGLGFGRTATFAGRRTRLRSIAILRAKSLAENVLLDLVRRGGDWQRIEELDVTRTLVAGQPRPNKVDHVVGGEGVARLGNDDRQDRLSPLFVRHAHERGV